LIIGKQGTTDSSLAWFAVGEYKKRANVVGGARNCKTGGCSGTHAKDACGL